MSDSSWSSRETSHFAVLTGPSGIGKSSIVGEFVYQLRDKKIHANVFWLDATDRWTLSETYRAVTNAHGISAAERDSTSSVAELLCCLERKNSACVFVIDNFADYDNRLWPQEVREEETKYVASSNGITHYIHPYLDLGDILIGLQKFRKSSFLLTTRHATAIDRFTFSTTRLTVTEVEIMSMQEAKRLATTLNPWSNLQEGFVKMISTDFDVSPMVLVQASMFLKYNSSSDLEAVAFSQKTLATLPDGALEEFRHRTRGCDIPRDVADTFLLNWYHLQKRNPTAANILKTIIYLVPTKISVNFIAHSLPDRRLFPEAIEQLKGLNFITLNEEADSILVHPLARVFVLIWHKMTNTSYIWQAHTLRVLYRTLSWNGPGYNSCNESLWVNGLLALEFLKDITHQIPDTRSLLVGVTHKLISCRARFLLEQQRDRIRAYDLLYHGQLQSAGPLLGKLDGTSDLVSMRDLAASHRVLGDLEIAEKGLSKILNVCENKVSESIDMAHIYFSSVTLLGSTLRDQGRYAKAREISSKALDVAEKLFGWYHVQTYRSMEQVAITMRDQCMFEEAEILHRKVLHGLSNILDSDHPAILTTMNNTAAVLCDQAKYKAAESMYRDVLERRRRVFGHTHPDVSITLAGLGSLLALQARYSGAMKAYETSLLGLRMMLGDDHPLTIQTDISYGILCTDLGQVGSDRSHVLYRKSPLYREVLGPNHLHTSLLEHALERFQAERGFSKNLAHIERSYSQRWSARAELVGEVHVLTVGIRRDMGNLHRIQGRLDKAASVYRETLQLYERLVGPDHPLTLQVCNDLGKVLRTNDVASLIYYGRVVEGTGRLSPGLKHPLSLSAINSIARFCLRIRDLPRAETMCLEALNGCNEILGPQHMISLEISVTMGDICAAMSRNSEAETFYKTALEGYQKTFEAQHEFVLLTKDKLNSVREYATESYLAKQSDSILDPTRADLFLLNDLSISAQVPEEKFTGAGTSSSRHSTVEPESQRTPKFGAMWTDWEPNRSESWDPTLLYPEMGSKGWDDSAIDEQGFREWIGE